FLGEWGEALHELTAAIAMAEKNGDARRVQTFRVYQAGIHFQALDCAGVREICESLLPELGEPAWSSWRRFCLVWAGAAERALGNECRGGCECADARTVMRRLRV